MTAINEHVLRIAATCYAAEREWQSHHGSNLPSWEALSDDERDERLENVAFLLDHPHHGASAVHEHWIARRAATVEGVPGWKYGPHYDAELKTDPKMMAFGRLSPIDQLLGLMNKNIVAVLGRV